MQTARTGQASTLGLTRLSRRGSYEPSPSWRAWVETAAPLQQATEGCSPALCRSAPRRTFGSGEAPLTMSAFEVKAQGLVWWVLHRAERSYLEVARALHPVVAADLTIEHAREEWREILAVVHRVENRDRGGRLERWRAPKRWDQLTLVVEPTPTGNRVCDVLAPQQRARPPTPLARAPVPPPRVASPAPAPDPLDGIDPGIVLLVLDRMQRAGRAPTSAHERTVLAVEIAEALDLQVHDVRPIVESAAVTSGARPRSLDGVRPIAMAAPATPRPVQRSALPAPGPEPRTPAGPRVDPARKAHWKVEAQGRKRSFERGPRR